MHGTFYINSGNVEAPDNPYYMTWADVNALNADGNEIGGHTVDHKRLSTLTADQQHHEICDDAAALRARGYTITDFAYPFGDGAQLQSVRQALSDCGYQTGRKFGDLRGPDCPSLGCATSETIPPADPYAVNDDGVEAGRVHAAGPGGVRDAGREQRRRLGAGRVPRHLQRVRRRERHAVDLPAVPRLAPAGGRERHDRQDGP